MTTVGFGIILLIIGLIITGTGSIWLTARRRGREQRTQKSIIIRSKDGDDK